MTQVSDSPSVQVPALYTKDVAVGGAGVLPYFVSETIWCAPRRVVALELTDFVFSEPVEGLRLICTFLTRRSGGGWVLASSLSTGFLGASYVPAADSLGPTSPVSIQQPTQIYAVLDEARLFCGLLNTNAPDIGAQTAPIPDPSIPDTWVVVTSPFNGDFFNLFGVQARDPGLPNHVLSGEIIDDPDRAGQYLLDFLLGTDADGMIVSALSDWAIAIQGTSDLLGYGSQNNPTTPLPGPIDYVPLTDGYSGESPPVSFTATVR